MTDTVLSPSKGLRLESPPQQGYGTNMKPIIGEHMKNGIRK